MISHTIVDTQITDEEEILAFFILNGNIFINNGHWDKSWPKDKITIHVNCNDVFMWGCADSEDINYSELKELFDFYMKDPKLGVTAWCIKKRKEMPQKPLEKMIKDAGVWNLEELIAKDEL